MIWIKQLNLIQVMLDIFMFEEIQKIHLETMRELLKILREQLN